MEAKSTLWTEWKWMKAEQWCRQKDQWSNEMERSNPQEGQKQPVVEL
jgi:hypothetical protein